MKIDWKTESPFLDDIVGNLDDATPRLIYADWLEEQGDPRCEVIRISEWFRDERQRRDFPYQARFKSPDEISEDDIVSRAVRFHEIERKYKHITPPWIALAMCITPDVILDWDLPASVSPTPDGFTHFFAGIRAFTITVGFHRQGRVSRWKSTGK